MLRFAQRDSGRACLRSFLPQIFVLFVPLVDRPQHCPRDGSSLYYRTQPTTDDRTEGSVP